MKAVCSYCHVSLGDRGPLDDSRVTHGVCPSCCEAQIQISVGRELTRRLGRLEKPAFALTEDLRIIAGNEPAMQLVGKSRGALLGLKMGEFLECDNSRQIEGCGANLECKNCNLRRTVEETLHSGGERNSVTADLQKTIEGVRTVHRVTVTTSKMGDWVILTFDAIA